MYLCNVKIDENTFVGPMAPIKHKAEKYRINSYHKTDIITSTFTT